jgi:chromosome segregation ATPase
MATTQLRPEWQAAADEIWAVLKETDRIVQETAERQKENAERQKETDRQMKETDKRMKETDKRMKETDKRMKETDKQMKETDERMANLQKTLERIGLNVGGLNRSLGELIETLIAARLWEKFADYNLQRAYQRVPIFDETNRTVTDIDILLSNTDVAMAVEVKRELDTIKEVDAHLKRMELVRRYPPKEIVGKKLLGAMAGGVVAADIRQYAWKSGFYVLELTGDTVELTPLPEGFVPRQW